MPPDQRLTRAASALGAGLLRLLPPEPAHRAAIGLLKSGLAPRFVTAEDPILRTRVWGRDFPNPLGLAAGFDKNAEAPDALLRLGFGFVEVGTVTPLPQPGNPRPRLFRDRASGALVNRLGFNGHGLDAAVRRLESRDRRGIVGANVGRNKLSPDGRADFTLCVARLAPLVDYLVVNVSSPNTPGLRDLQEAAALDALLEACLGARDASRGACPLLVKIAPDLDDEALAAIAKVALEQGIDGLIVGNTTVSRPAGLPPRLAGEAGGLSGRPLRDLATERLRAAYRLTCGRIPLVGVGGISDADDAFAKIRAGASLVQLYSALIFGGPALVPEIARGLARLLRRHGFASVGEAVGTGA